MALSAEFKGGLERRNGLFFFDFCQISFVLLKSDSGVCVCVFRVVSSHMDIVFTSERMRILLFILDAFHLDCRVVQLVLAAE